MIRWCECTSCFAGKSNLSSTLTSPVQSQSLIPADLVGCIPQNSGWIVNYFLFTNKNTFTCEQSWCVFGLCVWPHCFIQKLLILDVILPPHPPAKVHHLHVHHSFCCTTCRQIHGELPGVEVFFQREMVALLRHGCFYLSSGFGIHPPKTDMTMEKQLFEDVTCTSISYWEIGVFLLSCLFSGVYKKPTQNHSLPQGFEHHTLEPSKSLENLPEDHTLPQHPIKGYKGCASEDGWSFSQGL